MVGKYIKQYYHLVLALLTLIQQITAIAKCKYQQNYLNNTHP